MEWFSWNERIMARADPMEMPAVVALSIVLIGASFFGGVLVAGILHRKAFVSFRVWVESCS
jgi:hypothetical protein